MTFDSTTSVTQLTAPAGWFRISIRRTPAKGRAAHQPFPLDVSREEAKALRDLLEEWLGESDDQPT